MNFLRTSPMENKATQATPSVSVKRSFNWIEVLIIPIATCLMEAQPVALTLLLISFPITGLVNAWPLGEVTLTLLLLGLRWWAMGVHELMRRGMSKSEGQPLQVLGLFLALGAMIVTHLWFVGNVGAAIVGGVFVVWFWQRGINVTQLQDREDHFILVFKIGFGVVLLELVASVLSIDDPLVRIAVTRIFTTFFFSGLLALSFLRLSAASDARTSGIAQTTATRNWLFALTFIWGVVVVAALSLETFSFQIIQNALLPLWNFLGWLANGIAYLFFALFAGLFSHLRPRIPNLSPAGQQGPQPLPHPAQQSAHTLLDGHLLILLIAFALLILVVIIFLRRWNVRFHDEDEEEVRESLPVRKIARERQEAQRRAQQLLVLEPLAPNSARARYRDMLQTMATQQELLARRPQETPRAYQQRLVALLKQMPPASPQQDEMLDDTQALNELTQAYVRERYGNEKIGTETDVSYTHTWAEQLAKRLGGLIRKDT